MKSVPVLEQDDLAGAPGHEGLHGVLVGQVVAAPDRVERMEVQAVILPMAAAAPPSAETVWLRIG